ncbi:MAG: hypothetical protein AB8B70_10125 [Prochlorococcus sp.]|nr:hypothetical protein [Prochlorococcaceae cyanobacterium Fu_MAG_50]
MSDPTAQELQETIAELSAYRNRLRDHVISLGKKLRLPQKQIEVNLSENPELQKIEGMLSQLVSQREAQS